MVCAENIVFKSKHSITRREFIVGDTMKHFPSYLSGFVDGEGCFCVTFNKSNRHKFGWDIRPSFSVSQNRDRSEVLRLMKKHFGCGTIRPDRSDRTLKYEVRSVRDLVQEIIPHFKKYPLLSSKKKDFKKFEEICEMMIQKEHLIKEGFRKIASLAQDLNTMSKKKYHRNKFKV